MKIAGVKRISGFVRDGVPVVRIWWKSGKVSNGVPMMPYLASLLEVGIYDPVGEATTNEDHTA